ncbi:hypothetical protein BJ878DRAFT_76318 [Calycina marina]|uniref:Uncharacterized protein n=1 Tax=Calycina marina TaxID=1763456 RepID=A0A9P7ZB24_9HELO|nr:hypothetical protein BJ878DRAFT_76318 [Calycina marina]
MNHQQQEDIPMADFRLSEQCSTNLDQFQYHDSNQYIYLPYASSLTISDSHKTQGSHTPRQLPSPIRAFSGGSIAQSEQSWQSEESSTPQYSTTSSIDELHYVDYELPCVIDWENCPAVFNGLYVRRWIAHSHTHFDPALPPSSSLCLFCDDIAFQSPSNRRQDILRTWEDKMMHVLRHVTHPDPNRVLRPDFLVIQHLHQIGKMTQEEYNYQVSYTERPAYFDHPDLVPLGTPRPKTDKEREHIQAGLKEKKDQATRDFQKEERQRRRERAGKK